MSQQQLMVGDICPPCQCEVGACKAGIQPSNDCVRQLKGRTEWHKCDVCGMYAWKNNGTCINCARVMRDERKEAFQKRFEAVKAGAPEKAMAEIQAPPPNQQLIEDAEIITESVKARPHFEPPTQYTLPRLTLELYGQTIVWEDPAIVMAFVAQALGGIKK